MSSSGKRKTWAEPLLALDRPAGLVLDARGGLVLTASGTLVVSDLHLGYAEAHQRRGHLLGRSGRDQAAVLAVLDMVAAHGCRQVVLLGDLKHEPGPPRAAEKNALRALLDALTLQNLAVHVVLGNHDRGLARWLDEQGQAWTLAYDDPAAGVRAVHGDKVTPSDLEPQGRVLIAGHVHPAVTLHDGRGARLKLPVFLVSENRVVLPAMSRHAGGQNVLHPPRPVHPLLVGAYRVVAIDRGATGGPVLRRLLPLDQLRARSAERGA